MTPVSSNDMYRRLGAFARAERPVSKTKQHEAQPCASAGEVKGITLSKVGRMGNLALNKNELIELTAQVVAAYVENNSLSAADVPALIQNIHGALSGVATGASEAPPVAQVPAVSIKKSLTPEHLICLEDGRQFKSLKRHLRTKYNMSPEEYRAKWGLPKDYPMVAPNYAKARSDLAKEMGLGQGGRQAAKEPAKRTRAKPA